MQVKIKRRKCRGYERPKINNAGKKTTIKSHYDVVKIYNTADSIKCNLCNPAKMLVLVLKWHNDSETFVNF